MEDSGVSREQRILRSTKLDSDKKYRYFMNEVRRNGYVVCARDSEWLSIMDGERDVLLVWPSEEFGVIGYPLGRIEGLTFVRIPIDDFIYGFTSPPYDDLYVAVMPDYNGNCPVLNYGDFLEELKLVNRNTLLSQIDGDRHSEQTSLYEILKPAIKYNMKFGPKGKLPG